MNKEVLRLSTSEAIGNFLLSTVGNEISDTKNLETGKLHLASGGSLLLYFNHFAKLDTIVYGGVVRDRLTSLDNVAAITSFRHIDPEAGIFNRLQGRLMDDWREIFGITTIPVVQDKDKEHYPGADEFNKNAVKNALRFLRIPGHVLAIAPEGTRSKTNQLLQAKEGFDILFRLGGDNVLALPLAGVHHPVLPYSNTSVIAGEPFSYSEILAESQMQQKSVTDAAMRRLAQLLPEANRGYYL